MEAELGPGPAAAAPEAIQPYDPCVPDSTGLQLRTNRRGPGAAPTHLVRRPFGPRQPPLAPHPLSPGVLSPSLPTSEAAHPHPHPRVALTGVYLRLRAA